MLTVLLDQSFHTDTMRSEAVWVWCDPDLSWIFSSPCHWVFRRLTRLTRCDQSLSVSCRQSLHLPGLPAQRSPRRSSLTSSRLPVLWWWSPEPLLALHSMVQTHRLYVCIALNLKCFVFVWLSCGWVCFSYSNSFVPRSLGPWHSDKGCSTCKFTLSTVCVNACPLSTYLNYP